MAISPETQQHQPNTVLSNGTKSRTRQRRRSNNNNNRNNHHHEDPAHASDSSYSSDSSSGSSQKSANPSKQRRQAGQRRQRNRKNNNNNNNNNNRGRKSNKQKKQQATTLSQEQLNMYVALDCEMVGVGLDGLVSELARVTIVGWDGHVILDEYVKPTSPVTDYRTFVSGITPEDLEDNDKVIDIETCRVKVQAILEGRILVGHALKNDLVALGIRHPWFMTRDTAKYEPFMWVREYDGMVLPRKLKDLSSQFLKREIQLPGRPHCPQEDAVSAMDLYKTVRGKWESVMEYKINKTRQIEMQQHLQQFCAAVAQ